MADWNLLDRDACPVCGGRDVSVRLDLPYDAPPVSTYLDRLYEGRLDGPRDLSGQRYTLLRCAGCRLAYQRSVLDQPSAARFYADVEQSDPEQTSASRGLDVRRRYSFEVEQLLSWSGRRPSEVSVVDFGAGWGMWLDMAAAYGCRTTAVEVAPDRAAHTEHRHPTLALDELPADTFDFVNAEQVVEHLADPLEALRRLRTSVRPGGLLRVNVPNGSALDELLGHLDWTAAPHTPRSAKLVSPLEHVNCFEPGTLRELGRRAGWSEFHYPARQYLHGAERIRHAAAALVHAVRRPVGTLAYFQRH